jgi:cell wall assembly regulator SMI1
VVDSWEWFNAADWSGLGHGWIKPRGPFAKVQWTPDWIPLFDNTQGDLVLLDMNPPKRGTRGQLIDWWRINGPTRIFARSFRAFLERFTDDIENDRYRIDAPNPWAATLIRDSAWRKMQAREKGRADKSPS